MTKLTREGELLVKGPSVFKDYYKNPAKTKETFTSDGWFKTGDLVSIDANGYISFKAREKEIIALSTGKKVSPAYLEEKLEALPSIQQAFVFGDSQKHIGAIVIPCDELKKSADKKGQEEAIAREIEAEMHPHVSSYEQVRKFILAETPFTVENGMMTPTLKLRRKEIEFAYAEELADFYKD